MCSYMILPLEMDRQTAFVFKLDDLFRWHPNLHYVFNIDWLLLLLAGHVAKELLQVLLVASISLLSCTAQKTLRFMKFNTNKS